MLIRLLRLAVFTLFWSLLACLLILIISNMTNSMFVPDPLISICVIVVLVVSIALSGRYLGSLIGNLLGLFPTRSTRGGIAVLAYVEQAIRMNAPLSPMLDAAAKTERGRLRWQLEHLREMIDGGVELSVALQQEVPDVSARAIGLIAAGERSGQLRTVLVRLLAEAEPPLISNEYDSRFALAYIMMMLTALTIALALLGIFVEPKFLDILHDFHMKAPAINQWVVSITATLAPVAAIVLLVLMLMWLIYGLWVMIRRPPGAPRDIRSLLTALSSFLPWFGQTQRDRSWADVCRVLSDSFAAGWPADAALDQAQQLSLAPSVRSKVRNWNAQVQSGTPLSEAAQRAALPGIFVGILSAAGDQAAAALDFLGRYYTNRFSRLRILLRGALVPAVVLFFAACVTAIALSIFLPLIEMINHLAAWAGGVH